mmetsp:Transcript_29442/g.52396  ORF Transcript_29442/g.52396 Transcript_29442/m.52396 type:complete len:330 (-) Transcript_29442:91-1080(-)
MQRTLPAVMRLYKLLNLPTDSEGRLKIYKDAAEKEAQKEKEMTAKSADLGYALDHMQVEVSLGRSISFKGLVGRTKELNFDGTIKVDQGTMVAFFGDGGVGKSTLLNVIAGRLIPQTLDSDFDVVNYFIPPHLRVVNVSSLPVFYTGTLLANLTMEFFNVATAAERQRVTAICKKLQVPHDVLDHLDQEGDWMSYFSGSTCQLLSIARALVFNADITCYHKPLEGIHSDMQPYVMSVLREHINSKGLELGEDVCNRRRPRTIFLTSANPTAVLEADMIYKIENDIGVSELSHKNALGIYQNNIKARHLSIEQSVERANLRKTRGLLGGE